MIKHGDCRDIMRRWIANGVKVQCCVTSPPYYGLRDYGVEGQIGLERTPAEYVANLVEVFSLVRELLTDDGTLWLNLGDSYASIRDSKATPDTLRGDETGTATLFSGNRNPASLRAAGLKHKDLIGIPWRVAFALQAAGWWLRQDIIWAKPNPMPESVTDRCTKAHEYVFLMTKSASYFYDAEAIKEPSIDAPGISRGGTLSKFGPQEQIIASKAHRGHTIYRSNGSRNKRSVWTVATQPYSGAHFATFPPALITPMILAGSRVGDVVLDPFMGSGTTGEVAERLGRRWLGCELNREYGRLQKERTAQIGMPL